MQSLLNFETLLFASILTLAPILFAKLTRRQLNFELLASFVFYGALAVSFVSLVNELTNVQSWELFGTRLAPIIGIILYGVLFKLVWIIRSIFLLPKAS